MKAFGVALAVAVLTIAPQRGGARSEHAVPFNVGETLTYDVSWSAYLAAGTATTSVTGKLPSRGSVAYALVAEGRPLTLLAKVYALYYRADSLLDAYTLLSQGASIYSEEGSRKRTRTTEFDRKTQPGAQDPVSALYALRATALKPGDRFSITVIDKDTYQVQIDVGSTEPVRGPFGALNAWRVRLGLQDQKGQPVGRNVALWISTDARRLPLKLQAELPAGTFNFALRTAQ